MELEDGKREPVDPEVRAYIYSIVSAVGGTGADESGRYVLGDDVLGCLKDLKRWLKLYDERLNRLDVARCLAEANLVTGDLLPIIALWKEDEVESAFKSKLALACLELLVPLTWPLEKDDLEMTVNHHRHFPYLQRSHLFYKRGILNHDAAKILRTAVRVALPSMSLSRGDRSSRDEGIIKLVLYFIRNIAIISQPPNLPVEGDEEEVSRSATINAFHQQDVFALVLTIASNINEDFDTQDAVLIEILYHLVKGVDPEQLFSSDEERQEKKSLELRDLLQKEAGMNREYARTAPTRHNRFGTMIWVKRNDNKVSTLSGQDTITNSQKALHKMDASKKWNRPKYHGKSSQPEKSDFDVKTSLKPLAVEHLRVFVEEFLDSGFNPLFDHMRKAIERQADRILNAHSKQFFYLIGWFLRAERTRRRAQLKKHMESKQDFEADSFALVASVLNQETFIGLNRFMQLGIDNKEWEELHAGMLCFTQILLIIQEMTVSPLEEDQEIAENIQNRIFYEETTHDRVIGILRDYKEQGFGYLDACTDLAYTFLRMLEAYSRQNVDLQVRSRRRDRRKKAAQANGQSKVEQNAQDEEDEEEIRQADIVSRERKFDFTRFSARFITQKVVDTFVKFTNYYRDLNYEQLKRAHRYFYRVAFKQEMGVLLFRLDIIALFNKMIKGPEGLPVKNEIYKDWEELTRQIFKKLIKKTEQRPELIIELLFSKINTSLFYLQHGYEKEITKKSKPKPPARLEVKPGRSHEDQVNIVVAALSLEDKNQLLWWMDQVLEKAANERKSWEDEAAARQLMQSESNPDHADNSADTSKAPTIFVSPNNDNCKTAMFKDNKLRLLLELMGFERLGGDDEIGATWIIPSAISSEELSKFRGLVKKYENEIPIECQEQEIDPRDLIRRINKPAPARRDISDESGEFDIDLDALFPAGGPTARKSDHPDERKKKRRKRHSKEMDGEDGSEDEAAREARRKARAKANLEKQKKVKSELFVHASDDESDEERDREFFAQEEERRKKQAQTVSTLIALAIGQEEGGKSKKRKENNGEDIVASKRRRNSSLIINSDDGPLSWHESSSPHQQISRDITTDTPFSSQDLPDEHSKKGQTGDVIDVTSDVDMKGIDRENEVEQEEEEDDDDDDEPVAVVHRRRLGGFVIDSDSE
ncbi:MAG: Topoisomerase 1-associated factor 1 [Cirrosporium novae-zelandiae]|nr:MAG: Topoisomerase 1-associated factor 1 [Cirrosporium novae-zelandiae]